jgi:epoxyqueuosine reductase
MSRAGPLTQTPTDAIARAAQELGFCRIGFAAAEPFTRAREQLTAWLSRGYAGNLNYLANDDRADPSSLLPGVKTIVAVALSYGRPSAKPRDQSRLEGSVARYAQGEDYHLVVRDKLVLLAERCREILGPELGTRVCVDTAPLLEHEAARAAGIGFTAKSTLTIVPGAGSLVVLGELLLDVALPPSAPVAAGCGSCRACLDACPTGAFVDAFVLDARRCISYLTIEHQGPIPRELRRPIGTRVFGCDVCQEVCPFNASRLLPERATELTPRTALDPVDLVALLELGANSYRKLVKRTALRRASRATLSRNAAIALGNSADARASAPLARALAEHSSAVVRSHAAWALGELGALGGSTGKLALERAEREDPDADVREEAALALARLASATLPA